MVYKLLRLGNVEVYLNSVAVFENECLENRISISDPYRLAHFHNILKAQVGQDFKVTLLNQGLSGATITHIDSHKIELEINQAITKTPSSDWHLLVGLSRPPTMKKILEHGSSLGIKHFHFFSAKLSEKSYADSKIWGEDKAQASMIDGLSQSAYYWQVPKIHHYKNIQSLPDFSNADCRLMSLVKSDTASMKSIDKSKSLVLAFGPERGFTADEDESLQRIGFQAVSLGPCILRVEIAVFAALGQAHLLL